MTFYEALTLAMRLAFRLSMGALTVLTGAAGAALALWPAWLQTARDGTAYLPWASGSWKQLVINADGQVSQTLHQPFILSAIALLAALVLASLTFEILKRFAKLLSSNVKGRDTVARYGGEEFAVILPQTEMTSAMRLASQFKHQLETQVWVVNDHEPQVAKVTASFGIAQLQENDNTRTLVQRADANLYAAKSAGRNRIAS